MGTWTFVGGMKWTGTAFTPNAETRYDLPLETERAIHLADGDILCAGLVDTHAHLWAPGAAKLAHICAQQLSSSGVVAALDLGSYGYDWWEVADRFWSATNNIVTRSYLNINPGGHMTPPGGARTKAKDISLRRLLDLHARAEGRLLGFKLHLGGGDGAADDREWLEMVREAGDRAGAPIAVHLTNTYLEMADIVPFLKAGDVLVHVCHGRRGAPLDKDGSYSEAMLAARGRGVLMDCATGINNFSWEVFDKAAAKGFYPDFYANDMLINSWQDGDGVHRDLPHLISSFAAIGGVPLQDLFAAVTTRGAALMGIEYAFDCLAVLRKKNIPIAVTDSMKQQRRGDYQFTLDALLRDGRCWINHFGDRL